MRKPPRSLSAAAIVSALAATTALTATAPASAASYHCTTSKKSVDDPAYWGPLPDNYDFTTTLCAKRSGSTIYAYAKISFDGAATFENRPDLLDAARFHLQIKRSVSGPDPVVKWKNHYTIEDRLETNNKWGNGSYTTPTLTYKAGSSRYLADGFIQLDWNNDGKGYRTTTFSASPTV
ncbi:hypothetical protein ACN2WE_30915 [Streptomyces sp. cg28]|uniref:hypothetical protein n=1 Tax=Streptomyces sp. cg28 TaxID=3403457 RepID=UPI003B217B4D